ncbi:hypothetical protein TRAPUB_7875 [Trametes pubescens]|uniref:Uncharacterized protein n=1 Tax=Trametes pubescens TaxID=154538 RepID=A0A1M2V262_TRAPU|nr:hypothetical protein TRAPUB_7875 [Trametes pubescens]
MKCLWFSWPLASTEWLNIRRSVTALMETLRFSVFGTAWDNQLLKRLQLAYSVIASCQTQDPREPRTAASDKQAEITDLLLAPTLRQLIHAPVNTKLTADAFQPLLASLPALQEEWHQECARVLGNLVQANFGPQPTRAADGVDLLTLAVASFDCNQCKRTDLRWPNILAHRCARSRRVMLGESNQRYLDAVLALRCRRRGLTPRPWEQTFRAKHERPRCDWLFGSYRAVKNKWQVLDAEHTATVLKLESDLQEKTRRSLKCVPNAFGCVHCRYHSDDASAARNHCGDAHKIDNPKIDLDYYVPLDSTHAAGEASSVGPILIYPEYSRTDRVTVKDVKEGRAFFSPSLFDS